MYRNKEERNVFAGFIFLTAINVFVFGSLIFNIVKDYKNTVENLVIKNEKLYKIGIIRSFLGYNPILKQKIRRSLLKLKRLLKLNQLNNNILV